MKHPEEGHVSMYLWAVGTSSGPCPVCLTPRSHDTRLMMRGVKRYKVLGPSDRRSSSLF